VARIDAHAHLLVGGRSSGAELDAAAGHVVDHRHPLGHPHRVVVGQDHDAEPQADTLGEPA